MQMFVDHSFFVWLALLGIPAFLLGVFEKPIKYYGMAASVLLLWLALGHDSRALGWLLHFCLIEYAVIQVYLRIRREGGRKKLPYRIFLAVSISPLVLYKLLAQTGNPHHILGFLGISYMTFKVAQIIIEIYDGMIREIRPFEYAYLMLFFPTVTAGPIDRSRRFREDLGRTCSRAEYLELAGKGVFRILLGMVYKLVIAALLYFFLENFGMKGDPVSLLLYYYGYGFYLFFDFAGYSLMAMGAGNLFGIQVPENFNKPFASRNINEFWNRWHITLSHWLRDYVFSRITMELMRTKLRGNRLAIAGIAFMINMLLMGCWHGLTWYYITYGLYHGLLLTGYEILRTRSRLYQKCCQRRWFAAAEWFVTLHLVLFGFFLFSGRAGMLLR